jgi:hypothetical protein
MRAALFYSKIIGPAVDSIVFTAAILIAIWALKSLAFVLEAEPEFLKDARTVIKMLEHLNIIARYLSPAGSMASTLDEMRSEDNTYSWRLLMSCFDSALVIAINFVKGVYLMQVVPSKIGNRKKWYFCLYANRQRIADTNSDLVNGGPRFEKSNRNSNEHGVVVKSIRKE